MSATRASSRPVRRSLRASAFRASTNGGMVVDGDDVRRRTMRQHQGLGAGPAADVEHAGPRPDIRHEPEGPARARGASRSLPGEPAEQFEEQCGGSIWRHGPHCRRSPGCGRMVPPVRRLPAITIRRSSRRPRRNPPPVRRSAFQSVAWGRTSVARDLPGRPCSSGCGPCLDAAINEAQSSGGFPRASILAKTVYGSVLLPEDRNVRSSFIHAWTITLAFASWRKNSRNRLPILARRQWRKRGPSVFPWRYSARDGSCGITSDIGRLTARSSLTFAFDANP